MLTKLDEYRYSAMKMSRQAGMAEIATGVLHNIGNALTNANVLTSVMTEKAGKSKVAGLTKAMGLMREHEDDLGRFLAQDRQGQQVVPYLVQLASHLNQEMEDQQKDLASLGENLQHIKQILGAQQTLAKPSNVIEAVDVKDVLEKSIAVMGASMRRHNIRVELAAEAAPMVSCDRVKLSQVVVNLLTNAKDAICEAQVEERRVGVRLGVEAETAVVEVTDTGVGIKAEDLERVFAQGFTTKHDGHGFGLHYGAGGGGDGREVDGEQRGSGQRGELPPDSASESRGAGGSGVSEGETTTRRILVIDDEPIVHEAFRNVLTAKAADHAALDAMEAEIFGETAPAATSEMPTFEVEFASQGEQGCAMAEAAAREGRPYSVAFVDMRMPPGWDGLETIERLWKVDPGLEVVICSAYSDHPWEKLVARLGFSEHLLILKKPFEDVEVRQLACALSQKRDLAQQAALKMQDLQGMVEARTAELRQANERLQEQVTARAAAEDQLKHGALHDGLTGLPNRVLLTERIERCLERAKREKEYRYALLFLDLDNFKLVNDTLGHTVGDRLLVEVAQRLQSSLRALDTASRLENQTSARLGGDEFVVLLDGLKTPENAEQVAQRVLSALCQPALIAGQEVHVGVSIGLAKRKRGIRGAG